MSGSAFDPFAGADRVDDDTEIARLAGLKSLQYERERESAAERLGLRVSILDKLVAAARGNGSGKQGRPLEFAEIEPWPGPVDGSELLDGLVGAIGRHIVAEPAAVRTVALWVVAVHGFAAFNIFPRLFITAPEAGCGKTTLLDLLGFLVPRPLAAASVSPAALFRAIAAHHPTMLLDEFDANTGDKSEELRQIIDGGHKRGGAVLRAIGDDNEPRIFDAYTPMAIAAIDKIARTLMDRSLIVTLRRRRPDEPIASLRLDRPPADFAILARQAARWAADHGATLAEADPAMPDGILNRVADNWRPLFAVAELVGDGWADLAAATAYALQQDDGSIRQQLLGDIRETFAIKGTDRLASDALAAHLATLEDRPWPEWGRAKRPITNVQVARLLKPLGIAPQVMRLPPTGALARGYRLQQFADAFARYLPREGGFEA